MAIYCADLDALAPAYLDGELGPPDLDDLEHHVGVCGECRARLARERASLDELRAQLAPPKPPASLQRDVRALLDREDRARSAGATRWVLPAVASLAAAAALAVFALDAIEPPPPVAVADRLSVAAMQEDALAHRFSGAPLVRVSSGTEAARSVGAYLQVPVTGPGFDGATTDLRGWQPTQLAGRSAAKLAYELTPVAGGPRYLVDVYMLDGRALALDGSQRVVSGGAELWVASSYGINTVAYKDRQGIGYVVLSEMPLGHMIDVVLKSSLMRNANQRVFGK